MCPLCFVERLPRRGDYTPKGQRRPTGLPLVELARIREEDLGRISQEQVVDNLINTEGVETRTNMSGSRKRDEKVKRSIFLPLIRVTVQDGGRRIYPSPYPGGEI